MPKSSSPSLPLNGLFAINKPTGPTSMRLLEALKKLFNPSPLFADTTKQVDASKRGRKARFGNVKIGQGGTLDPLADGVLVVGVNKGTKQLQQFLDCSKEYRTTALLGCSTDTFDSTGSIVSTAPYSHLTPAHVESVLDRFRGEILQFPPIYSALKMDGKALYEYARNGEELPRPIQPRKVTVHELVLESWQEGKKTGGASQEKGGGSEGHNFKWPEKEMSEEEKALADTAKRLIREADAKDKSAVESTAADATPIDTATTPATSTTLPTRDDLNANPPPVFTLRMTVSSGTYVRSIVHDIALALHSAAHVVVLQRTRQGDFSLPDPITGEGGRCIDWDIFEKAIEESKNTKEKVEPAEDEEMMGNDDIPTESKGPAMKAWEQALLAKFQAI